MVSLRPVTGSLPGLSGLSAGGPHTPLPIVSQSQHGMSSVHTGVGEGLGGGVGLGVGLGVGVGVGVGSSSLQNDSMVSPSGTTSPTLSVPSGQTTSGGTTA